MLQPINNADFVVPVEIDGTIHQVYVLKRPYVDDFLQRMGELYECILFTASLAKVIIGYREHILNVEAKGRKICRNISFAIASGVTLKL